MKWRDYEVEQRLLAMQERFDSHDKQLARLNQGAELRKEFLDELLDVMVEIRERLKDLDSGVKEHI